MCSYRKEVLTNDADYNVVTVVMTRNGMDLTGAVQWISKRHDEIVANFLKTREDVLYHRNGVPSWGEEVDQKVYAYIDGLGLSNFILSQQASVQRHPIPGHWIRGHDEWCFRSSRLVRT